MNSRRNFIKQSGLLATSLALAPSLVNALKMAKPPIGLQLWSVRDLLAKDVKGVIKRIAEIGYKEIETYEFTLKDGFLGLEAKAFAKLLKQNGLKAPSGHYALDYFLAGKNSDDLKLYIEAGNIIGNEYITVPSFGSSLRKSKDDYKKIANKLNEAALLCKSSGLKLSYHNHDFEFTKFDNTTGYEILLNETDPKLVDFEMDLYWTSRSGLSPAQLIKAHPGRFTMWHIKDMDKANKDLNTEIGMGAIDFKAIFALAKLAGVKHYFVEHETNYKPDELGSIQTSFNYVKNQLL